MLQHWSSEGEFYIGGFELCQLIELVTFARCMFTGLNLGVGGGGAFAPLGELFPP